MENKHILTVEQFKELVRPVSKHVDEAEVMAFVSEVEDMRIIPAVGLDTFEALLGDEVDEEKQILLDGGVWVYKGGHCQDEEGKRMRCVGLKKALAYFAYAKMIQTDGSIVTRTCVMRHNYEYAQHVEAKARKASYNDVMNIAEEYLSGCLLYWKSVKGEEVREVRGSRVHIHAIGA